VEKANFRYERKLWREGLSIVAGVDEVGRGAWAGPLLAAAAVFPTKTRLNLPLRDSKAIAPKKRVELAEGIKERARAFSFGQAEASLIEKYGISFATEYAMLQALKGLEAAPDFVLVDFFQIRSFPTNRQKAIKKGDHLSASIAAASVLAKVERDAQMVEFDKVYPGYEFASHKGYGTRAHQQAIKKLGPSKIHRLSFIPSHL